ncbi:uncharacterized protein LOC103946071 [Pyrus x bretschneideri]|uniref:uncharacterized protein LOC103946071 n=1 Tax=Pyrus x bretschneideri TaxID=225117 RepID=UPI0020308862|nr:uncharacterized protein LOC103946071 [Pyrus x bretschneideri]
MSEASLISKPEVGDTLIVYLSVSASAVSSVLFRRDGSIKRPVYYASKALQDAETRYSNIEKLALALVMSAQKLRPYFQAHFIIERIIKWATALGEFDISYHPKLAEKGQTVADFIAEFTYPVDISPTPEAAASSSLETRKVKPTLLVWTLYVDSSSNQQGCGAGLVLITPDKVAMGYTLRFKFKASNNEAKYEALLAGLRLAKHLGVKQINIFSDSQLVVNQVTNNFDVKDNSMAAYLAQMHLLLKHFHYQITQVPRAANSHVDALARLASAVKNKIGRKIHAELLATPSTMVIEVCNLQQGDSWITPIYKFLVHSTFPNDKVLAKQIRYKFTRYLIINDQLYKRGFNLLYLWCLTPVEAEIVLREIHEGVYGDHTGSGSLAHKAFRQGYYWPTLYQDAIRISRSCDKCQRYVTIHHSSPEPLTPMISHWPFAQWGLDLIGPMPAGKGKVRYAIVAVDYFTKWAEVEPLATITEVKIEDFVWKNILCRFGIPNAIITDNGRQFDKSDRSGVFHGSTTDDEKQLLNLAKLQPIACEELTRLLGKYHIHRSRDIDELNTWKSSLDQQVKTGDSQKLHYPQQRQIQEEVERLLTEQLRDFQHNKVIDEVLRRDMTNINRSPFTNEIKQAEPPRKFSMPYFTSFKGDGDLERYFKQYRSVMILYQNNDDLTCKIFTTTL